MATNIAGTTSGDNIHLDVGLTTLYSQEVLHQAQPLLLFEQFAERRTELGIMSGQTIKMLRFAALSGGTTALSETTDMETDTLSTSELTITVAEYGKAVQFSEMLVKTSMVNVLDQAAIALGRNYALVRDTLVRNALYQTPNTIYANGRANRAGLTAADVVTVATLAAANELLATNKAPKFDGGSYVGILHPHQGTSLRADSRWQSASHYGAPDQLFNGESGKIENVRVIETSQIIYAKKGTQDFYSDGADSGMHTSHPANDATNVYLGLVLGSFAVGIAEALPVNFRDGGVIDMGRRHKFGWYAIFGVGLLESNHSVIIETA